MKWEKTFGEADCSECGTSFTKRQPRSKYCSGQCYQKANYKLTKARKKITIMKEPIEIQYVEIALKDVLRYFAKDFDGYVNYEAFVDTAKDIVIFRLNIDENKKTHLATKD